MITENLSTLKINTLSQKQYDRELASENLDATSLYLTPIDEKTIFLSDEDCPSCLYRMNGSVKEWLNPPMQIETEYRTMERLFNRPIYTQLFKWDSMGIGDGQTEVSQKFLDSGCYVIRFSAFSSNYLLPHNTHSSTRYQRCDVLREGTFKYSQGSEVKAADIHIQLWYYKK